MRSQRSRRRLRAAAAVLLAWGAALLPPPRPARAHAIVLEARPAHDAVLADPPVRVVLRFNGRIEKALTRMSLTRPGGTVVPLPVSGPAAGPDRIVVPLPPLGPGTYVLRYKVLAADGHITEGALRFTVQATP